VISVGQVGSQSTTQQARFEGRRSWRVDPEITSWMNDDPPKTHQLEKKDPGKNW